MKKKLVSILMSSLMVVPAALGITACGDEGSDAKYQYDITVWVGEYTQTLTENQIKAFNETNNLDVYFKATVEVVSESKAAGDASSKPESAADLYCFAEDQLARLVEMKALASLNSKAVSNIEANCDEDSVQAAKVGTTIRAFPLTADNGYFMYYDKSVIDESHVGSLEALIEDCENAGRYFAMDLGKEGGWYAASFFYAAGCVSEWPTDENGKFLDTYTDTFDSDEGMIALKGMQKLLGSTCYLESSGASEFSKGTPAAVVVSGIWDYNTAKTALGNNLGIAPLPSFTVDGEDYELTSYLGHKFMGVKPQSDAVKAAFLQELAAYLTSKDCQLQRFQEVGWGPANKEAQQDAGVLASPALSVFASAKTVLQGQYPADWWSQIGVLTLGVKENAQQGSISDATLRTMLGTYSSKLPDFVSAG